MLRCLCLGKARRAKAKRREDLDRRNRSARFNLIEFILVFAIVHVLISALHVVYVYRVYRRAKRLKLIREMGW